MRKISTFLIMIMVLVLPFINVVHADEEEQTSEGKKVSVYIFRGEGCPHCEEALEFFDELSENEEYSKMYELVKYEVWYDEDNAKLMEKVADALGEEVSGVPYIVIGDKTFKGYSASMSEDIKKAIKEQYESDSYKDYVKNIESGKKVTKKDDSKSNSYIPIIVVSVVALFTVIGLVFFTKEK